MFKLINSMEQIEEYLEKRKNTIKNTSKLPTISNCYLKFITNYESVEFTPDIYILNYESSLNENKYIYINYPFMQNKYWVIATSGQGDIWLMDLTTGNILFYDHNQGEFSFESIFVNLKIDFYNFLKLSILYRSLEDHLDNYVLSNDEKIKFKDAVEKISTGLFDKFLYKYF